MGTKDEMSRKVRQFTISNKLVIRTPMTALVLSLAQLMVAYRTSYVVIAEKQLFSILRCFNRQVQCSQRPIAPTNQSFSDLQLVANRRCTNRWRSVSLGLSQSKNAWDFGWRNLYG